MDEQRVWYAAYGSNLAWDRFRCYIHGGSPGGSPRNYDGCRVKKDPIDGRRHSIPLPLYFARRSSTWGNAGVAFIGHQRSARRPTMGRLFLLEHGQFEDVVAQENSARPGEISIPLDVGSAGYLDVREQGWYRRILHLGEIGGHPVLTCTAASDIDQEAPVLPSRGYLRWVCRGLHESWNLSPAEIASYLLATSGMSSGYHSVAELRVAVEQLISDGWTEGDL